MRQVTTTEKYRAVNEGKLTKGEFVRQMRIAHPTVISQWNSYNDTVTILKNKGFISEKTGVDTYDSRYELNISPDSIDRGVRYELNAKGVDQASSKDEDLVKKITGAVIKNLKKDPLHYINLLAKESSNVDKHDREIEVKRGEGKKDVFNGEKKATLKENLTKEASQEESVADYIIKHYTNPKTGKSLVDDEIVSDFFKTHPEWEQQADGTEEGMEELIRNFGEYLDANYEGPSDMREAEVKSHPDEVEDGTFPVAEAFNKVGIDMSKDVHVHYSDGGTAGLGGGQLKDKGTQSAESVLKMLEGIRKREIAEYEENKDKEGYSYEFPIIYEYYYYGDKTPEGKEFKMTFGIFEGETYDIFQESSNIGEEEKKELPKSIADKERDQIEKDAKKAKGMIKEKLTEVEAIQVGIDKGYSNEQIAAAISKLREQKQVNEYRGSGDEIKAIIRDRAADSGFSEQEEAQEVMEFIGQEYEIDFEFGAGPSRMAEKKGKDHDGDGDIDSDDYMAAKDKAIKKAMGKEEQLKEAVKNIIKKTLEEGVVNEAATQELAHLADTYGEFEGFKQSIIQLQDIVTDIESYYDKTRAKIQKVYDSIGDIRNEEGLKVGAFLAPSIESAFNKDLRPVMKSGFTKGLDTPKVKMISKAQVDAAQEMDEEPKQTVFSPVNEKSNKL